MSKRVMKQFGYGIFYLLFWAGAAGLIWWVAIRPPSGTCVDAVQNHGEQGIDCGGPCEKMCSLAPQKVAIKSTTIFSAGSDFFDVLVLFSNPNTTQGAKALPYTLVMSDAGGAEVARRSDTTFVLPSQERRLVIQAIRTSEMAPEHATVEIDEPMIEWKEIRDSSDSGLVIEQPSLRFLAGTHEYAELTGVVENRSLFDYDAVEIVGVVFDGAGTAIAARQAELRTVRSQEKRAFRVSWQKPFEKEAARYEVYAYTNVLDNENFLRLFGVEGLLPAPR